MKFAALILMVVLSKVALAAPATLTQSVTYKGETVTMQLSKENLRGANFELLSQNASGGYDTVTPVDERSYLGTIDEYPGAVSCGILLDNGTFKGAVYFDRGVTWFTLGDSVVETRALSYGSFSDFTYPTAPTVSAGQAGSTTYGFELGVDADHNHYTNAGNSVATALESIEYSVCVIRAIYMRDVLLRPYLGRVIIRASAAQDPYTDISDLAYLNAVGTEWNTNQTSTNPDLVAGVSPTNIAGGRAWVGVVGETSRHSINQSQSNGDFDLVLRHEIGHNWDSDHYVGDNPEGTGIMGGNQPGRFSGCEVYRVLNHRNSQISHLDDEGTFTAVELPPYASIDAGEFTQTVTSSLTFDVLANDHDANGQALSLLSFDSASAQGGSVTQVGQNLVYVAHSAFIGTDYFSYKITDTVGRTATGVVLIEVLHNRPLRMHLALDETVGTSATDASKFANTATLSGTHFGTASVAGKHGGAVNFDGTNDHLTVTNVQLQSNTVTITAWVKQNAIQNDTAGIIMDRSASATGLNVGSNSELRYHWNGTQWWWDSGLTPPAETWTFVALVIEPNKATMYMDAGSGFQSAINHADHAPATFGTTYVGRDLWGSLRHFRGAIDDARIYNYALSQAELQNVADENIADGVGAESPKPFSGATDVWSTTLRWNSMATATSHHVYLGTSQAAITDATQASPEYQGVVTDPSFVASLSSQSQYYWRVDTVTPSSTLKGATWSFTTATMRPRRNAIMLNFGHSQQEALAGGSAIGPQSHNSSYWNEGAGASGSLTALIDNFGLPTTANVSWASSYTWANNDGTDDEQHKLAVGYLDDSERFNGNGKGVQVTLSNIPFASYRVYGLFAADENVSDSSTIGNFDVNGIWALGGDASTTAAAWPSIDTNHMNNGSYWTQIVPGVTQGNYWVVETSGATCSITGEARGVSSRGTLTGIIIEDITDGDTDSMPDAWELYYFDDIALSLPSGDYDGDGFTNFEEYAAATDPTEQESFPSISSITTNVAAMNIIISNTSPRRAYTLYESEDLDTWTPVLGHGAVLGTNGQLMFNMPTPTKRSFYSIMVEPTQ